jgi:hypothetical protein
VNSLNRLVFSTDYKMLHLAKLHSLGILNNTTLTREPADQSIPGISTPHKILINKYNPEQYSVVQYKIHCYYLCSSWPRMVSLLSLLMVLSLAWADQSTKDEAHERASETFSLDRLSLEVSGRVSPSTVYHKRKSIRTEKNTNKNNIYI